MDLFFCFILSDFCHWRILTIREIHNFTPFEDDVKATSSFMWKRLHPSEARLHPSNLRFPMRLMQRIMWWRWWWDTLSGFYNESFKGVSADSKTQYFLCNTERVSITTDAEKGINERYLPFSHGICFRLYSTYVHHFLVTTDMFWLRLLQHSVLTIHHDSIFPYSTIPLRPNSNIYIYIYILRNIDFEHPQESDIPSLDDSPKPDKF